jgi:DNA-binding NarL/FixJ family response regulator
MTSRAEAPERSRGESPDRSPVGVLVVDDQLVFRQVAREVLDATPDFVLLGEASSGHHALAAMNELDPDLVLVDIRMPGMDGIETASQLTSAYPDSVVVLISIDQPPDVPMRISSCGARALVRKQDFGSAMLHDLWVAYGRESPA